MWRLYIRIYFFDKVQANQTNCNEIGIYTTWVFIERQGAFNEEKVAGIIATFVTRNFRNFSFPQQLAFWLIFQPRLKCNYGPFWHFPYSTSLTTWVFFEFVVRNCKILVQWSALFREISSPLKHFETSNPCNILIFESSLLSIPATFRLKVAEKSSWISWNSFPATLQDFKWGVGTLLMLMLVLSVTFSCHE